MRTVRQALTGTAMKTVALEDLLASALLIFVDSVEKIGYDPKKHKDVVSWFSSLTWEQARDAADKLLDIMDAEVKQHAAECGGKKCKAKRISKR